MTAATDPATRSASRRALLAGAIGGIGALVASAIGRPRIAEAHDLDDVRLGGPNTATSTTSITWNGSADVFAAYSNGTGDTLNGYAVSGRGVYGSSTSDTGIYGVSAAADGVFGVSGDAGSSGVQGTNTSHGYGVTGNTAGATTAGVWGDNSGTDSGVLGTAVSGHAIHGSVSTSSGFAGYFAGKVYTSRFHEMKEISVPAAPGTNKARLFLRDNGSGKTQLCVRFNTGGVLVIKTQP